MIKILFSVLLVAAGLGGSRAALAALPGGDAFGTEAKINEVDASGTALGEVPGGTVQGAELEKEHGRLIWSFDIAKPSASRVTEVNVDAVTGKIVLERAKSSDAGKKAANSGK